MAKRKHQLLTESERDQILAIPVDRDQLARLYTFEPSDIEIIGARRERRNRMGWRCNWRCYGIPARRWRKSSEITERSRIIWLSLLQSNSVCASLTWPITR
jgi:hypothetical protein